MQPPVAPVAQWNAVPSIVIIESLSREILEEKTTQYQILLKAGTQDRDKTIFTETEADSELKARVLRVLAKIE